MEQEREFEFLSKDDGPIQERIRKLDKSKLPNSKAEPRATVYFEHDEMLGQYSSDPEWRQWIIDKVHELYHQIGKSNGYISISSTEFGGSISRYSYSTDRDTTYKFYVSDEFNGHIDKPTVDHLVQYRYRNVEIVIEK